MKTREIISSDFVALEEIFSLYWNDPEFVTELLEEMGASLLDLSSNSGFLVALNNDEIVGVAGYKTLPDYLKPFSVTARPVELYVIAAKYQRQGIGLILKKAILKEAKKAGFSEILLYSPNTHSDSWDFHDTLGFERVGMVKPPEDELGQVWRKSF